MAKKNVQVIIKELYENSIEVWADAGQKDKLLALECVHSVINREDNKSTHYLVDLDPRFDAWSAYGDLFAALTPEGKAEVKTKIV